MKKTCLKIGIVIVAIAVILVGFLLVRGKTSNKPNPIATIQIEGYDQPIKVELDPQSAPDAVANFIKLANNGFYANCKMTVSDGKISVDESMDKARLSNIIENPQSDYIYGIKGDVLGNGIENLINHTKGVITMEINFSNITSYEDLFNSANARFSILTSNMNGYNGTYAAFGKVVEGMEVLDAIAETNTNTNKAEETENEATTETTENDTDETANNAEEEATEEEKTITIASITVDTFGVDYGIPEVFNFDSNYADESSNAIDVTNDNLGIVEGE